MAVQQNKKSPSKRGMHNAHSALKAPTISVNPNTGAKHRPHHIDLETGMYGDRKVFKTKADA